MTVRKGRSTLVGALVVAATALSAQGAQATTTPTISLDHSAGTQAGASQNLGMDLKFANSAGDSPDVMTINLPLGLLANASIDGGACLQTADLTDTNCQVGTGDVTADPLDAGVPFTLPVTFDLVPPPAPGDLAGLAVNFENGTQIGTTGDIRVRPSGDPDGVGISIVMTLPNSLLGLPMQVAEIDSTFDGLRYPTSCPSTPAQVGISVNSYSDATLKQVSAPLNVTGCSSLPYAPKLSVSAIKDSGDRVVAITTAVTQAADEAPTKNLALAFPDNTLGVNLAAVRLLCVHLSSNCTPVGTATAVSPLYPDPLTANAYLTGTALGPDLTLVFPAPFPLTLTGSVTLTTKTASFTGLPDIPLTSLKLVLNGGANGMFLTNCNPGSGVADGTSTDQNGDKTVSASVKYDIVGCPASSYNPSTSSKSGANSSTPPTVTTSGLTGFVRHHVGKHLKITGVAVGGARVKTLAISHGRLVIRLRRPAAAFRVRLTSVLHEDNALVARASRGKKVHLHLTLTALNTRHRSHTIHKLIGL